MTNLEPGMMIYSPVMSARQKPTLSAKSGGVLSLSEVQQIALLRDVLERGFAFRFQTRGHSMSPFIRDGDVLTVAPLAGKPIRLGDIVAWIQPDARRLTIHRVVASQGSAYLIRGDNLAQSDGWIAATDILGWVTRLERNGQSVRLGLGAERRLIAWLSGHGWLMHLLSRARRLRALVLGR
jgi:hypothetical protein